MFNRKKRWIKELEAEGLILGRELKAAQEAMTYRDQQIKERDQEIAIAATRDKTQAEHIRTLNAGITQLTLALEGARKDVKNAENAADGAIEAGRLAARAHEAALGGKDATIAQLLAEAEAHNTAKIKTGEEIAQLKKQLAEVQAENTRLAAAVRHLEPTSSGLPRRKPGLELHRVATAEEAPDISTYMPAQEPSGR